MTEISQTARRSEVLGSKMLWLAAVLVGMCGLPGIGQTAVPPSAGTQDGEASVPQLSPAAAYQQAMGPVEITRRSITNWSEVEQASLAVAIRQASAACTAKSYVTYSGNNLADFARLCALGQAWPTVVEAANRYLGEKTNDARMSEIYAAKIDAELHLKQEPEVLQDAKAMLAAVPYSSAVAEASDEALTYMEVLYTSDALSLAQVRQAPVLRALQTRLAEAAIEPGNSALRSLSVVALYRQGLTLALLEQFNGKPEDAKQAVALLDNAVASGLTSDDENSIVAMRRGYAMLGLPLGKLPVSSSLDLPGRLPDIPAHRAMTVLLLFPDWCAQCVGLARQMPETVFSVDGHEGYAYGLLAETVPPQSPSKQRAATQRSVNKFDPAFTANYLRGTPTLVVDPQLLLRFNFVDVPTLIATDSKGIVRYIGTADESAFQPGQTVDSLVAAIGKRWPWPTAPEPPSNAITVPLGVTR